MFSYNNVHLHVVELHLPYYFTLICIYHALKQDCLRKVVATLLAKAQRKFHYNVPEGEITHRVVELSELLLAYLRIQFLLVLHIHTNTRA